MVEGLGIKEGDLLEFELTAERALRVTVMKSSTVTRKPKKMGVPELQASLAKKKVYRGVMPDLSRSMMLTGQEGVAMSDLLGSAAAAAAAQGLPIRLPDINATQVHLLLCHTDVAFLYFESAIVSAACDPVCPADACTLCSCQARQLAYVSCC